MNGGDIMIAELVKVDTPDIPSGDEKVINDVHQVQHVHPFNIDGATLVATTSYWKITQKTDKKGI